ncbi:MAG TPA: M56 family metallopeptidase [Caulobacteraceae bacterium]|nr:M56 family metallopeptidase [Caulobacteraceae bacterium]
MLAWILYVWVVTILLSAAAYAAERSAEIRGASTRWLWVTAIVASLALPGIIATVSIQAPQLTAAIDHATPARLVTLRQMTSSVLAPSAWLVATTGRTAASPALDVILERAWAAASAVLVLGIMLTGAQLYRRKRQWTTGMVAGRQVYVSEDVGPAVVGLLRPRVVVPGWVAEGPAEQQELVMAHEQSHLDAGDARLLAIAILLIVTMPWNLPLWWQLRRLRFAIEVDCDARVLKGGRDLARYGEALIAVGERRSSGVAVVAAMSESRSFLEQRLRRMISKRGRFAWASASALAALGVVFAAGAAEVSPPNSEPAERHREIAVPASVLDGAVGFYRLGQLVLTIVREKEHLLLQLTGQASSPVFPESPTSFFSKQVDAQFTFQSDASGRITAVTLHQNGRDTLLPRIDAAQAHALTDQIQSRIRSQTQSPGTQAAVLRLESSEAAGTPDYDLMTPPLATAVREQLPAMRKMLAGLGPVQSVQFLGIDAVGDDVYNIKHANGVTHWTIGLDPDGKVSTSFVRPGP